ncbi:MAG: hypothetical protein PIR02_08840 [Microbacterium enclense]
MGKVKWHTYKSAAERVNRSERAIRLWGQAGMPMDWQVIDGQRTRVVREDILLKTWQQKMRDNPAHQNKLARKRREQGLAPFKRPTIARTTPVVEELKPTVMSPSAERTPVEKPMKGGPEYYVLDKALRGDIMTPGVEPACRGDEAFTADRADAATIARMTAVCAGCPALALCAAYAAAGRPSAGFWAGRPAGTVAADAAA